MEKSEYKIIESIPSSELTGNKIIVTIEEIEYTFKLKLGENFYFVIFQEIGGEQYVITN